MTWNNEYEFEYQFVSGISIWINFQTKFLVKISQFKNQPSKFMC